MELGLRGILVEGGEISMGMLPPSASIVETIQPDEVSLPEFKSTVLYKGEDEASLGLPWAGLN